MTETLIPHLPFFHGVVRVPGDKSLGHRALMLAALAAGVSIIQNLPSGADVRATRHVLEQLGTRIEDLEDGSVRVHGAGGRFDTPTGPVDCANSGTTMRLMAGICAGAGVRARLVGDESLMKRPMERVAAPLREMGADVRTQSGKPPLDIWPDRSPVALRAGAFETSVASAQVKSAILLAGLFAGGRTSVHEPSRSRDHTERFLRHLGLTCAYSGTRVEICGPARPAPFTFQVPGDPSSAAFPAAIAAIRPNSRVRIAGVLANPLRLGFFRALERMGATVDYSASVPCGPEDVADITVSSAPLKGVEIVGDLALDALDELPLLALLGAFAAGKTVIRDAAELRHKESDRVASTAAMIRALGGRVDERPDGLIVEGGLELRAGVIDAGRDHRIALCGAVAGTHIPGVRVRNFDISEVSYPGFLGILRNAAEER
ncbi:MAG: 3-phosphoshikimate 1-carboxyvinyltransferase [Deltaproteobacteria bacterium]|nr:3-phosphoshikimate 1-carboxyvinyltransferase [Deltaproteobacteria bacterium]